MATESVRRGPGGAVRAAEGVGGHGGLLREAAADADADTAVMLKPVPDTRVGRCEVGVYETVEEARRTLSTDVNWWRREECMRRSVWHHFLPRFHGKRSLPAEDGGGEQQYVGLQDLTHGLGKPCVLDIKIGVQSWDEDAPATKAEREASKWPPQAKLGYRFTGLRVHRASEAAGDDGGVVQLDTKYGYALPEDGLQDAFRRYVDAGCGRWRPAVLQELLPRLRLLKRLWATQRLYRFYGSSLLFVYDAATAPAVPGGELTQAGTGAGTGEAVGAAPAVATRWGSGGRPDVDVRMIDFGHAWDIRDGGRDDGYELGLRNIIATIETVLNRDTPAAAAAKGTTK